MGQLTINGSFSVPMLNYQGFHDEDDGTPVSGPKLFLPKRTWLASWEIWTTLNLNRRMMYPWAFVAMLDWGSPESLKTCGILTLCHGKSAVSKGIGHGFCSKLFLKSTKGSLSKSKLDIPNSKLLVGFNLWGRGRVTRKCTPRKNRTVLEPCWKVDRSWRGLRGIRTVQSRGQTGTAKKK